MEFTLICPRPFGVLDVLAIGAVIAVPVVPIVLLWLRRPADRRDVLHLT